MKTAKIIALLCVIGILLSACGSDGGTTQETTLPTPEEIEYRCPWEYDVCAKAVQDGTMHYYFMSSEGQISSSSDSEPYKWGDCCLIVFPDGQTMLVDCGIKAYGPLLTENLKRMGVKKLDYVVVTHQHGDHQGGLFHSDNLTGDGVLDQFEIGKVYYRGGKYYDEEATVMVETVCNGRDIPLEVLEKGDVLQIGQVHMEVLWPAQGSSETEITGSGSTAALNNSSIVMRFDFNEHSSLFTGDLYTDGEAALLGSDAFSKFDVDLLKAPHHGDDTSNSKYFVSLVSPKLAVATGYEYVGINVKSVYDQCKTTLLDDRTYGYVHVSTDGTDMTWETSRQEMIPGQLPWVEYAEENS